MNFVLVHGTSCGGWIWKKLTPILRRAGNEVYTPTLTGLAERSHLLKCGVDLITHITDVVNLLYYENLKNVVLVGHSYAGMVITGVAVKIPERLKSLVYLDAYVPDDGQTEGDLWPEKMRKEIESDPAADRGVREPPPFEFLGITDSATIEWMKPLLKPHPLATYYQPVPAGNEKSNALPRVFIHCTAGLTTPLFGTFAAKARVERWPVYEITTGHCAMLTAPEKLAKMLNDIAR